MDYGLPKNQLGRWLIYHLVRLYEATYYREFIKSDLQELLRQAGVELDSERAVLLGAGRILKGTKTVEFRAG